MHDTGAASSAKKTISEEALRPEASPRDETMRRKNRLESGRIFSRPNRICAMPLKPPQAQNTPLIPQAKIPVFPANIPMAPYPSEGEGVPSGSGRRHPPPRPARPRDCQRIFQSDFRKSIAGLKKSPQPQTSRLRRTTLQDTPHMRTWQAANSGNHNFTFFALQLRRAYTNKYVSIFSGLPHLGARRQNARERGLTH